MKREVNEGGVGVLQDDANQSIRATLSAMGILCGGCLHLGRCRNQGSVRQCDELEPCGAEGGVGREQFAGLLGKGVQQHGGAHEQLVRILGI